MKKLLILFLVSAPLYAKQPILPGKIIDQFVADVEQRDGLPNNILTAMDNMIAHTVKSLSEQGYMYEAQRISSEWQYENRSKLTSLLRGGYSIPDHEPLIAWLDSVMQTVIEKMGRPFCVSSHICDIYSFNKTIKVGVNVIFKKCDFSLPSPKVNRKDEHRQCMVTDGIYSGLYSVVSYWVAMGSCLAAGGNFVCTPIAMVVQNLCEKAICGPLADRIYSKKCEVN